MAIIEVNHLTKEYRLGEFQSLKHSARQFLSKLRGRAEETRSRFKALDDVHFSVEPGEVLGVIGTNGAGKSTLLKMLARISVPTSGSVKVHGRVAPLIEVGAGLIGNLTGRENIFLNGSILGMSRAEVQRKFDEIVEFAELEQFIDTPVKRYSSGMEVRLGFSIATSVAAEVLIVDEVLAVGDLAFQRKCFDRMEHMIKTEGRTVLLVSHNIRQVERMCTRAIMLKSGQIAQDGDPTAVCQKYFEFNDDKILRATREGTGFKLASSGDVVVTDFEVSGASNDEPATVREGESVRVSFCIETSITLIHPIVGVGIHTTDLLYIATETTGEQFATTRLSPGKYRVNCVFRSLPLLAGVYLLRVGIDAGKILSNVYYQENIAQFKVVKKRGKADRSLGFVALDTTWHLDGDLAMAQGSSKEACIER